MKLTWILERDMFTDNHDRLASAVENFGQEVIAWNDDWWKKSKFIAYNGKNAIFHGCLSNAARINSETEWNPGAFCNVEAFKCSSWYPTAEPWLLNSKWVLTTVREFVENPEKALQQIGVEDKFFVRPDGPLKPFSGRVLKTGNISLKDLDHGFYYDDTSIQIIISPVKTIIEEWRYIIVDMNVVAGSSYIAETRTEIPADIKGTQWQYAQEVSKNLVPPEDVYVMDICRVDNDFKLLELNPFSGADLYGCDRDAIVKSITELLQGVRK